VDKFAQSGTFFFLQKVFSATRLAFYSFTLRVLSIHFQYFAHPLWCIALWFQHRVPILWNFPHPVLIMCIPTPVISTSTPGCRYTRFRYPVHSLLTFASFTFVVSYFRFVVCYVKNAILSIGFYHIIYTKWHFLRSKRPTRY
jgi:hypothetical protein